MNTPKSEPVAAPEPETPSPAPAKPATSDLIAKMKAKAAAKLAASKADESQEEKPKQAFAIVKKTPPPVKEFEQNVAASLQHALFFPVAQVQSILNLDGDVTMSISDQGAMKITVDSGMTTYDYIVPAQSK